MSIIPFDMNSFVQSLFVWMALFNPNDLPSDINIAELEPPTIHALSSEYFREEVCACDMCKKEIGYMGHFYLDKDENPAVMIVADEHNGTLPYMDPEFQQLTVHELYHYVQFLAHVNTGHGEVPNTFEEFLKFREQAEREAYEIQNNYRVFVGIPPLPVDEAISWSMKFAMQHENCINAEAIPGGMSDKAFVGH